MPRTRERAVAKTHVLMVVLAGRAPLLVQLSSLSSCLSPPLQGPPCEMYLKKSLEVAVPTAPKVKRPMLFCQ